MNEPADLAQELIACLKRGCKILVCGNGGSAAQALHLSGELLGKFEKERQSLPCICLNADQAILTAVGNDYGYEHVFSRQVSGLVVKGDILLLLTTSGRSANLIYAANMAKLKGVVSIALSGRDGGDLVTDFQYLAPGQTTAEIQESHLSILHNVCRLIDAEY